MSDTAPWIDLVSGAFYGDDPYPAYAWMRRNQPVYFDDANGVFGIAKHRDVKEISKDPATFSSAGGIRPDVGPLPMMIDMDAPEHTRRRKLVSAGFTPLRVRAMEDEVRRICDAIIDEVAEAGQCDLVADVAAPLPLIVIGNMLGIAPEDRPDLLRWSDDLIRAQGSDDPVLVEAMFTAFTQYSEYMSGVVADRRHRGATDDLVGILVHAGEGDDRLDDDSLIHETLLILIGGDETTRHVISGGVAALLEHPEQMTALRADPALLPRAVEEMTRWVTPIKNMCRTTTTDAEVRGVTIPQGCKLLLLYASANRDEEVFVDPEGFDVARSPNDHVGFGFGGHFCLGNQLARMETRVMLERLMARLPDLHRAESSPVEHRKANFISGIESLPVAFTPTARLGG